ncbi:hypothetical protein SAMN05192529_1109 [Arachidicoccus rhizosphaerae]|uniref:Uncharacterized protein n=1 Tax=Arachidicoccus rhizosphaerae TaxID=551991 RepID=A0A1H3Z4D5_9BACT|nr:hypothetical protein [Arachidicoccus rhizosphaerae]SEA18500.1 hypothetical protein SAMN05192529_1109 [Arachidicoccus rhizosphaerae]
MNEFLNHLTKKEIRDLDRILVWFKPPVKKGSHSTISTLTDYIFKEEQITKELAAYYLDHLCDYKPEIMYRIEGFGNDKYYYQRTDQWHKLAEDGGFAKIISKRRYKEIRKNIYKGAWDIIKILVGFGLGLIAGYYIKK